ncbi:MAG: geranylgeranylglyceryl/heptaprenylglyceryl phosphate synthase [Candidatus Thermoplasmatota archaeon]|nr:geranylgeranylglyceryl/heptaprenylglyceryl phosphate synthase [Candidatus Thermoplasmatota archaeon]MBS3801365.1 geranylgeranylglyceryl/heptaprenylglyceryl phosphate synthase [Candidatus Thermoplasmatota archaeon]
MTLTEKIKTQVQEGPLHFSLIDPDKQSPSEAGTLAAHADDAGSAAIMVGGSTLLSQKQVDDTVKAIKENSSLPVILFPSAAKFLSQYADAVFFMSLLNSRNLGYVIREHVKGAPFVKHTGIEPISMGYLIVEPGMTAGKMGEVDLVKKDDIKTAVGYALSAEYLGMDFFYLEAGSGASEPVSDEMIAAVKQNISIPLCVGGGIRSVKTVKQKVMAGADIIVTGTALEKEEDVKQKIGAMIHSLK